MASEAVKVIVRCRLMNEREKALGCKTVVSVESARGQCFLQNPAAAADEPPKEFTFDGAYNQEHNTEQIYNEIAYPLVEGVTEGCNGTIFAYGQTGSGKSFTMQGIEDPSTQKGIIPRAFEHIFESVQRAENAKFLVRVSYLEIYNEDIRDLLGADTKQKLELKQHPEKAANVKGLSLHTVHSVLECEEIMEKGWRNRAVGSTLMNKDSSRSHSILTVNMEIGKRGQDHLRAAKLNLVDLAGSERPSKTGRTAERLREAIKINLSLLVLGNVISALVDGRCEHIPYRDSKLTRLLQDSLGGNTKTLMVACLSPADNNYEESLNTLRCANCAKNIKNKPCINEDPKDAVLSEYQEEIKKLKAIPAEQMSVNNLSAAMRTENTREKTPLPEDTITAADEEPMSAQDPAATRTVQDAGGVSRESVGAEGAEGISIPADQQLARLQMLERDVVGGEEAENKDLKEKHRRRKKYAEERRLQQSNEDSMDWFLPSVYNYIQKEIRARRKLLKKKQKKLWAAEPEMRDLQSESEEEETDRFSAIHPVERELMLFEQVMNQVPSHVWRDCSYSYLEKVKHESVWDEEAGCWKVPDFVIEKTRLPSVPALPQPKPARPSPSAESRELTREEDRYELVLDRSDSETIASNYFRSTRASRILCSDPTTNQAPPGPEGARSGAAAMPQPRPQPFRLQVLPPAPPTTTTKRKKGKAGSKSRSL
ncbi:kinesin-like protein KIF17 isoform X2 [Nyctibius grandis]|uniref:kinesin-like protein KIF17 isoform X2 n=1 Tax=Nyctibius grandis TaxID=48427 RepID=UPI0035BC1D72